MGFHIPGFRESPGDKVMTRLNLNNACGWYGLVWIAALAVAGCGRSTLPSQSGAAPAAAMPPPPTAIEPSGFDSSPATPDQSDQPSAGVATAAASPSDAGERAEGEPQTSGQSPAGDQVVGASPPADVREVAALADDTNLPASFPVVPAYQRASLARSAASAPTR